MLSGNLISSFQTQLDAGRNMGRALSRHGQWWIKKRLWAKSLPCCCCCCWVTSVMSDSVRPHRRQPTRLPHPWDSPGKNTGVGCHFLLQCVKVKSESEVAQSCPTLSDQRDCSLPGSSIHGIFQARVLEWGAIAFSKSLPYPQPKSTSSYLFIHTFNHISSYINIFYLSLNMTDRILGIKPRLHKLPKGSKLEAGKPWL